MSYYKNNQKNDDEENNQFKTYDKEELEDLFELPDTYDSEMVEQQASKLLNYIHSNEEIHPVKKKKIITFLTEAKKKILENLHVTAKKIVNDITDFYNSNFELKPTPLLQADGTNFVQDRKHLPFLESYPSEYFPGIINPLKKKINRQYLNIDTRFRDNYFSCPSTNFHFDLPIRFTSIVSMQLSAFEMPVTYFNIFKQHTNAQSSNNFFAITIKDVTQIVTIPNGNYSSQDMVIYLNTFMSNLQGDFNKICFTMNITSDFSTGTGQMVVGIYAPHEPFPFTLNFQTDIHGNPDFNTPLPLKLGWILGFRNGVYTNNTTYVSEGIVDLTGPRYLYLAIDDYNNNVNNQFYAAFNNSIMNKNILARITIQAKSFDIFTENNFLLVTTPRQYFGPVDIQKLHVQLLDEYGRIIFLNNMDFSFCLTFQSVYDI